MSLGTANRDGGKTSESGHLRALTKAFRGEVSNGLSVSQRGAGANMSVDIAVGDAFVPRSDGTYAHPVFNDAVLNQVIATADPSNPRRDILVLYVDYGNAVVTTVSNNTNGVVKVKVVAGTPAGSPVDPTDAAIQTSVGSGNPFIKLARIRVGTGVGSIGNSVIDDLRRMATAHVQGGWLYEYLYTWVYVSASSFKITGVDARAQFPVGSKIMLFQAGVVAYFTVVSTAFSTDTTVTLNGNGIYTLANNIIDHPAYSYEAQPQGWPWTLPYNPYKFAVYYNGSYSISNAIVKIPHNTKEFDTDSDFDAVTNFRYTAKVPGYYVFMTSSQNGSAGMAGTESSLSYLFKNGAEVRRSQQMDGSGNANRIIRSTIVSMIQLAAGDYIEHYGQVNGARDQSGGANQTFMHGFLESQI